MNDLRTLPLSSIIPSATKAQAERRAHFDQAAIAELAESIKTVGLLSPLVVRPAEMDCYEIVAGERRYLAAQLAGLAEIPCSVRDLTDEQVLEVQLVENLQREDLHPLIEAEGYEGLQQLGHSIEEIALKVGKSERTIYARMQLLQLCPEARTLAHQGLLTPSTALLVARIRPDDRQLEAAREVAGLEEDGTELDRGPGPMSYRKARDFVRREYMLALGSAPFDQASVTLLPEAGSCSACPKRTGNNPDLFGDVDAADVCTDPPCFDLKVEAHGQLLIALAKQQGRKVITGEEAEQAVEWESNNGGTHVQLSYDYVKPDDRCYADQNQRTYKELLGGQVETVVLKTPEGTILEVLERSTADKALKAAGLIERPSKPKKSPRPAQQHKVDPKLERKLKLNRRIFRAIFDASPTNLRDAANFAAADTMNALGHTQDVCEALGWDELNMDRVEQELAKMSNNDMARLLRVLPLCEELSSYGDLTAAAKRAKVNVKLLEQQLDAELAAKASPAPAKRKAPKKAGRKAK